MFYTTYLTHEDILLNPTPTPTPTPTPNPTTSCIIM